MVRSLVCAAIAAALAGPAPAALAAPARIALEGDGSIYTMDPDGSARDQLTDGSRYYEGPIVDDLPHWSPSGRLIAFQRNRVEHPAGGGGGERDEVWVMRADGTHARPILPGTGRHGDDRLIEFLPTGEVLIERSGPHHYRYVAVDPATSRGRRIRGLSGFGDLAFSPDGRRVAGYNFRRHGLSVARADGSHVRLIARKADQPAWSPDGRRLAFASEADHNGEWCGFEVCDISAEIYVADADGGGLRRLTFEKGDDREPTWSPDGRRIAFQSDRNWPHFYTTEIYSIRADGRCLTWLTNGAIESGSPAWSPRGSRTAPGGCGAAGRRPARDLDLAKLKQRHYPLFWFGPSMPGRMLLSDLDVRSRVAVFSYADCGYYTPKRCGRGGYLEDARTCTAAAGLLDLDGRPRNLSIARGALVYFPAPYPYGSATVFTGVTTVELPDASYVRDLRRYPNAARGGALRPPRLPEWLWEDLERTRTSYARTHSEKATAAELGMSRAEVHHRLALARRLRRLGVDGRVQCDPEDAPEPDAARPP